MRKDFQLKEDARPEQIDWVELGVTERDKIIKRVLTKMFFRKNNKPVSFVQIKMITKAQKDRTINTIQSMKERKLIIQSKDNNGDPMYSVTDYAYANSNIFFKDKMIAQTRDQFLINQKELMNAIDMRIETIRNELEKVERISNSIKQNIKEEVKRKVEKNE